MRENVRQILQVNCELHELLVFYYYWEIERKFEGKQIQDYLTGV
jgi:hypothetical protein